MLIVLSPSKTLDFEKQSQTRQSSTPELLEESKILIDILRRFSRKKLAALMGIGDELAQATLQQFVDWNPPFTPANAKQAVLAFRGNAYVGLDAESWSAADFKFAQQSLRILSGLHGVLKPLDLIQPYRLGMGTTLKTPRGSNLYAFWGTIINEALQQHLSRQKSPLLMNLASAEYFKSIKPRQLDARIITPNFKEARNGSYKAISAFAKKARGLMASYIIRNRLTSADDARAFDAEGYRFNENLSTDDDWIFTREES